MLSEAEGPLYHREEVHTSSTSPTNPKNREQQPQHHLLATEAIRTPRDSYISAGNSAASLTIVPPIIGGTTAGSGSNNNNSSAMSSGVMTPPTELRLRGAETYYGLVETVEDAILLVEACRRGMLPRVSRRLGDRDRALIRSGSIFVFVERESGIKRWTDGKIWSPSRITGEFLSYRQLEQRVAPVKRPLGEQHIRVLARSELTSPEGQGTVEGPELNGAGPGTGTLLKKDGLVKKTISLRVGEETCHLISYMSETGVDAALRRTLPSRSPLFASLKDSQIFSQVVPVRNTPAGHSPASIAAGAVSKTPPPILPITRMISPPPVPPSIPRSASVPTVSINPSSPSFNPPIMAHPLDKERNKILLSRPPHIQHGGIRSTSKVEISFPREPYRFPPHVSPASASAATVGSLTSVRAISGPMVASATDTFHARTVPRPQQTLQTSTSGLPALRHQNNFGQTYSFGHHMHPQQPQQLQRQQQTQSPHQPSSQRHHQRLVSLPSPMGRPSSVTLPPLQKNLEISSARMNIGSLISGSNTRDIGDVTHGGGVTTMIEEASVEDDSLLLHHFVEAINSRSTDVRS